MFRCLGKVMLSNTDHFLSRYPFTSTNLPEIHGGTREMGFEFCLCCNSDIQIFNKVEWPHQRSDYNKTVEII